MNETRHTKPCTCINPVPHSLHDNRCIRCGCPIPEQIMIHYRMIAQEDDRGMAIVSAVAILLFLLFAILVLKVW